MNAPTPHQLGARRARPVPGDRELALSRQRRDRAEAAGGDRCDHQGLRARLRDRASRRVRALGGDDRELRGGARGGVDADRRRAERVVFTRGATEAINLVARTLPKDGRNRVLLSQLEHHCNIVPWQLAGYEIDVVPLTRGRPDRSRRRRSDAHRRASRRRLRACLERARLDPRREARGRDRACEGRAAAARRLPGGAAPAGRCRRDRRDFYAFSGAQALRPDRHRRLWGRAELLDAHAAVAGRRGDDRHGHVREDDLPRRRRRGSRPARRTSSARSASHAAIDWVEQHRPRRDPRARMRAGRRVPRGAAQHRRRHAVTGPRTAPGSSASTSTGCIRTTSPPYWTMRASPSAPGIIARSR